MQKWLFIVLPVLLMGAGCSGGVSGPLAGSGAGGVNQPAASARAAVDCTAFTKVQVTNSDPNLLKTMQDFVSRYQPGNRGYLPGDIADVAGGSSLCGSIDDPATPDHLIRTSHSYYLSPLSSADVYAYFRDKLSGRGCSVDPVNTQAATPYMPFTCNDGNGQVGAYSNMQAYFVNFSMKVGK